MFSGEKHGVPNEGPFLFEQHFGDGLWALSTQRNEAGKTSVLEIIIWALRGDPRAEMQSDVMSWLSRVELDGSVDDQRFFVHFDVLEDGSPSGSLKYDGTEATFASRDGFAEVMTDFMFDRLGLASFTNWVKDRGRQTHGWPSYTGGLYLPRGSWDVVLGDTVQAGLPGRLLLMFVGVPWAQTKAACQTAKKGAEEGARKADVASSRVREAAEASLEEVRTRLAAAKERLDTLPDGRRILASLDNVSSRWSSLVARISQIELKMQRATVDAAAARSAALEERKRLQDQREARIAERLFHGMSPTLCPRCSEPIGEDRHKAETEQGHCAVCDRELAPESVQIDDQLEDVDDSSESPDAVAERAERLEAAAQLAEEAVRQLGAELATQVTNRDSAREEIERLRGQSASAEARRNAEIEVARLEAQYEQLQSLVESATTPDQDRLADVVPILKAAVDEATYRVESGFDNIVEDLNREILELARAFGIEALQSVEIDQATRMRMEKGGVRTTFGKCTPGEKLRLRIAVVVALLRVAAAHGVGRHPGLLLVDSIGAEETESENLAEFMRQLAAISDDLGIETIVASARTEILDHVPQDHQRAVSGDDFLW